MLFRSEDTFDYLPPSAPKRGVRPGALMDTGDAMPNTEFHRPNPLGSDTIMDATARLLAPRRSLLSGLLPKPAEKAQKQGKKKQAESPKPKPARAEEPKKARQAKKSQKPAQAKPEPSKKAAPPQQQTKKGSGKSPRRDRPMPPEPPRKNQPKDSTEQASLMKPYYLDIGR